MINHGQEIVLLRSKAEELHKIGAFTIYPFHSEADNIKLIHELQVHQIELELQNEELKQAVMQAEEATRKAKEAARQAEEAKEKYTVLYNSAPTGYFTLSNLGDILELNYCGAAMLGKKRFNLIGSSFGFFVKDESRLIFNHFLNEVFTKKVTETCDVYILSDEGLATFNHLTGIVSKERGNCKIIAVDITLLRQAEEVLRSTNYKLEFLMNSTHLAWWDIDLTTGNVEFNKSKVEVLGFSPQEFKHYSDFTAIVHPDDQDKLMKAMQGHIDGRFTKYEVEYRILTKSGDYKWFYDVASISKRNSFGQPVNVTGFALDITERKLEEEILLESRFRSLFDKASEGILIMTRGGKISNVNKAFAEMHGYTLDELLDMNIRDLDVKGDKTFENNKGIINRLENGEVVRFEVEHFHKDGHTFPLSIGTSLINVAGEEYYQAFHKDITRRKLIEKTLAASEEKYRLLSENTTDGVALFEDNKVKYVSKGYMKMVGFYHPEIENISFEDIFTFIHKDDAKLIEEKIKTAHFLQQKKIIYSYRVIGKNGEDVWIEDSVDVEYDSSGNHLRSIIHSRNITERKRAAEEINLKNQQLVKLNLEKDKLFSIIAHDLRSPFHAFLGLTDLFANDAESLTIDQVKRFGTNMNKLANNYYGLLQNLLEWAQMQKESTDFLLKEISLTALIVKNIELLQERSQQKGIDLCNLVIEPFVAFVDEKMINSVILNLLSNAIKFTSRGGSVTVNAKNVDTMIEISITDTGIGISTDEALKLFKLGEKTGQTGTDGELSTGLGLLLCKEFVEKHGGIIRVESEEGIGSTFYFTVPIAIYPKEE